MATNPTPQPGPGGRCGSKRRQMEETMNRLTLRACCTLMAGFCYWPTAVSASDGQRDFASETRSIFAAKCAGCHGAALAKPKGRFGYVLDLARVAANPEIVIPSFPDESELWELV